MNAMKLADYLKSKKLTQYAFAKMAEVTQAAVQRYATGKRIPDDAVMLRIYSATNGDVTANDFYDIPPQKPNPKKLKNGGDS